MSNKLSPGDRVDVDAGLGITKTGNVQRITESTVFVKHYNGAVVGYRTQHVTKMLSEEVSAKPRGVGLKSEFDAFMQVMEKTLTPAELKKREEVAKAMERENPDMPMDKKMAIATATAKKVAEEAKPHTVPKTAKEKSLAALAEPKDKITHADVMVGRGVKKEELEQADEAASWNPIKHIPKEKQNDAIKTAAKDVKRGSYADRAALLRAGGVKKEETEQIDELSKDTLASYAKKAETDVKSSQEKFRAAGGQMRKKSQRDLNAHITKRFVNMVKAQRKIGVRQGFTREEDTHYCAKHVFSERFGEGMVVEGQHAEPNEQGLIEWYDVDFGGTVRRVMTEKVKVMHAEYHMNHKKKMKEEDEIELDEEQLDELNKDTLISYQDKADADITRKHRVLGPQIKAGDAKAANKTSNTIGKRMAGIDRAVERLNKEEVELDEEQLDELSKGTLASYVKKAVGGDSGEKRTNLVNTVRRRTSNAHNPVNTDAERNDSIKQANKDDQHFTNRVKGIRKAVDRLAKEEVDLDEAMISYSDFQSKIDAHRKAGNEIRGDKYDKKKASYTVIDQEGTAKKITHTDSGVSQQHLGSMKRDDDESSETKSTEKRGPGRPTGSKSGARN